MNIDYRTGDLLAADAEALVNAVNCVGVMGKGIALQFKKAFPDNFRVYSKACARREVRPGEVFVTERYGDNPKYIINFPTKRHWRARSRLADVESGLTALADQILKRNIGSIAMPALGCGNGGLQWSEVRCLIERVLGGLSAEVRIVVFEPGEASAAKPGNPATAAPELTAGRAALVMLMDRHLAVQPEKAKTLPETTVHELTYFLQAAGEPLQLGYSNPGGGPYAAGLRRVLRNMEGLWISCRHDVREESGDLCGLKSDAVKDAELLLADQPDTRRRVARVGVLMDGFETPLGVALLANVHWVLRRDPSASVVDVMRRLHGGKFYRKAVEQAYLTLQDQGWLHDEERSGRGEDRDAAVGLDVLSEHHDAPPPIPININTATVDDLATLPRVGSKLAQAIVTYRAGDGPFRAAHDVTKVPGIGRGLYTNLAPRITVGEYERRLI